MQEQDGRFELATLAATSGILESVVQGALRSRGPVVWSRRGDVMGAVAERVTLKIMDPSAGGFDFKIGCSASFSGYVRQMAHSIVPTAVRDEVTLPMTRSVPMDHGPNLASVAAYLDRSAVSGAIYRTDLAFARNPIATPEDRAVADEEMAASEDWADEVELVVGGASHILRKPEHRPHYAAAIVLRVTGTPEGVRPSTLGVREKVRLQLESETGGADAMKALRAVVSGTTPDGLEHLMDVFADYTPEDAQVLLARGAEMARAVALSAVSRLPLPNLKQRMMMSTKMRRVSQNPEYRALIERTMRAVFASECCSNHSSAHTDMDVLLLTDADAQDLRVVLDELRKVEGAPLGTSPTKEILPALRAMLLASMPPLTYDGIVEGAVAAQRRRRDRMENA